MTSPATPRPALQERSRKTLDALLDAAEQLLEQKSYAEISLTELVGTAGLTTGAFYSRFDSKNDLLPSLYQRYLDWLRGVVDDQLDPARWKGRTLRERTESASDLICRLFETRAGLLRAMVVFSRLDAAATVATASDRPDTSPPQMLLIESLCDRLDESLAAGEKPARDELEFAVYGAITLARENILFPGLPMARSLRLDPQRLRVRLARQLELTLSEKGSDRS